MSKEAYRIVVRSVRFSGEGERNIGICAEPSLVSDNESEFFALHFGMSGADNDDFMMWFLVRQRARFALIMATDRRKG
jgi:hypothetical protein